MGEQKTALIKQVRGLTFAGKSDSNHWVTMDGPEQFGGSEAAVRPKELLLLSLGGCSSADVVSILQKKRAKLDDYELNITADTSDSHPVVFTKIHLEYVFYGKNLKEKDLERAIELSQDKYCGVTAMLKDSVEITHSFKVVDTSEEY